MDKVYEVEVQRPDEEYVSFYLVLDEEEEARTLFNLLSRACTSYTIEVRLLETTEGKHLSKILEAFIMGDENDPAIKLETEEP